MNYINDYSNFNPKIFAFDTETNGLKYDEMELTDISFSDGENSWYFNKFDDEKIKNVLLNAELIIGHNLNYDLTVLTRRFGRDFLLNLNVPLFDTMLAQYVLDETAEKGLKILSKKLLHKEMIKYEEARNSFNKDKWREYSTDDAVQTYKLYEYFKDKVKDNKIFERECQAIFAIVDMQNEGFLIDKSKFSEIKNKMIKKLSELENDFIRIFSKFNMIQKTLFGYTMPINLNSSVQLKDFIINKLGFNISDTSVKTLKYYKNKHEFFKILLEYRHVYKLFNSYIKPFELEHIQSDGKVHSHFNPTGTTSGRFSSSNINMQQIPAYDEFGMRQLFIAEKGYKIVCLDYAGQELRLTAIVSNDKNMKDAFLNDKDLHLMTANSVYHLNIPSNALKTNHKDYKLYKDKYAEFRKKAKFVNFGLIYGASAKGIANLTGETETKAQEMLDNFFAFYTDIKKAIKQNTFNLYKNKEVENIFGRKRRFKIADGRAKRQAFNFLVQGSAGDMLKIDLRRVWKEVVCVYREHIKLKATVHDEIIFMISDEKKDEIIPKLVDIMQDFDFEIPIIVDYDVGNSYGEAH